MASEANGARYGARAVFAESAASKIGGQYCRAGGILQGAGGKLLGRGREGGRAGSGRFREEVEGREEIAEVAEREKSKIRGGSGRWLAVRGGELVDFSNRNTSKWMRTEDYASA